VKYLRFKVFHILTDFERRENIKRVRKNEVERFVVVIAVVDQFLSLTD
jgi:hypothetical protein